MKEKTLRGEQHREIKGMKERTKKREDCGLWNCNSQFSGMYSINTNSKSNTERVLFCSKKRMDLYSKGQKGTNV